MNNTKKSVCNIVRNSLFIFVFFLINPLFSQLSNYEKYTTEDLLISGVEKISSELFIGYGGKKLLLIKIANNDYKILYQVENSENIKKIAVSNNTIVCLSYKGSLSLYELDTYKIKKKYLDTGDFFQNIEFIRLIGKNLIFCSRSDNDEDLYKICIYSLTNKKLITEIVTKTYWNITDVVDYNNNYFFIFFNGNVKYIPKELITIQLTWQDLQFAQYDIEPDCYVQNLFIENCMLYLHCGNSVTISNIYKYKINDQNNLSIIDKTPINTRGNIDMNKLSNKILLSSRSSGNENLLLMDDSKKIKLDKTKSFNEHRFGGITNNGNQFIIFGYNGIYRVNADLSVSRIACEK